MDFITILEVLSPPGKKNKLEVWETGYHFKLISEYLWNLTISEIFVQIFKLSSTLPNPLVYNEHRCLRPITMKWVREFAILESSRLFNL